MAAVQTAHILEQIEHPACQQAKAWIQNATESTIAPDVLVGLRILVTLSDNIAELNLKHKAVYRQLQRALGVLASSAKARQRQQKQGGT